MDQPRENSVNACTMRSAKTTKFTESNTLKTGNCIVKRDDRTTANNFGKINGKPNTHHVDSLKRSEGSGAISRCASKIEKDIPYKERLRIASLASKGNPKLPSTVPRYSNTVKKGRNTGESETKSRGTTAFGSLKTKGSDLGSRCTSATSKETDVDLLNKIYDIIEELYNEELVPTIHEIRRKLQRNNKLTVEAKFLMKLCSDDDLNRFEIVMIGTLGVDLQKEWMIGLIGRKLINYSNEPVDSLYIQSIFDYLVNISTFDYCKSNENMSLGGRYMFAKHLKLNGPVEFRDLSIGFVIHILQKVIELGILVYKDNSLVPVVSSSTVAHKFINNYTDKPNSKLIKENIVSLLEIYKSISLCTLPAIYKQHFGTELNYDEFGYSKLTDLINYEVQKCTIYAKDHHHYTLKLRDSTYTENMLTSGKVVAPPTGSSSSLKFPEVNSGGKNREVANVSEDNLWNEKGSGITTQGTPPTMSLTTNNTTLLYPFKMNKLIF